MEVISYVNIEFIFVAITIRLCQLLAESNGQFKLPVETENLEDTEFENLKHSQNPGHLLLTAPSILYLIFVSPYYNVTVTLVQQRFIINGYLIWSLIFSCSVIIEHDFFSDFIVVANSFYIFADINFIN